jgi:hemerythrin-like domain-containing protein
VKPTDILKQEHRAIERMLRVLETAVQGLLSGRDIPSHFIPDAIHFIQNFADKCHHGKEEDILFPAMHQKGFPRDVGPLAVMLHEHDEGRSYVRGMLAALEEQKAGIGNAVQRLATYANSFIQLLREHIVKEDNILFVMADQQFSESEQQRLSDEFQRVEATRTACIEKSTLFELLERLERDVKEINVLNH